MLLDDTPEYDLIWDKIYEKLKFNPSIKAHAVPFEIDERYAVYKIDEMTEQQVDTIDDIISKIFVDISKEGSRMYALDWQHSAFLFDPRNKDEQQSFWKEDSRYIGGGYNAYFPSFYPNGDYYFFIDEFFRFGYLGHPWRKEIWVWGHELIDKIDENCNVIGFKKAIDSVC